MENDDMKKCPYCAESIKAEAVKCRYCGSSLTAKSSAPSSSQYWQRVAEGKKVAGVCTGIARQFDAPILVLPLRVFFLVSVVFWGFGLISYIILWILMAPPTDRPGTGGGETTRTSESSVSVCEEPPPGAPPAGRARFGPGAIAVLVVLTVLFFFGIFSAFFPGPGYLHGPFHGPGFLLGVHVPEVVKAIFASAVVLVTLAFVGFFTSGVVLVVLAAVGVALLAGVGFGVPMIALYAALLLAAIIIVWQGSRLFHGSQRREGKEG